MFKNPGTSNQIKKQKLLKNCVHQESEVRLSNLKTLYESHWDPQYNVTNTLLSFVSPNSLASPHLSNQTVINLDTVESSNGTMIPCTHQDWIWNGQSRLRFLWNLLKTRV
ncbi:hypothetical protein AMECASPLE_028667 [Ameca splendens]|uniref:Uncharacterized protein n=1 Tax=Ameca splendens TaxID=208324 RepID=A0ABV0XUJ9_9TELE